ncbi:MAG: spore maturation protein [Clostridia bacterium]|nr:spore maturation protein [Clostridia bacterium]
MADILLPTLIACVLMYSLFKKVDAYASFVKGAKESIPLIVSLLPYIVAMFIAIELFRSSGLSAVLCKVISPLFNLLGIPAEVTELTIIRPFSSNAAYVLLKDIFTLYGPDSYIGKCASVIMGSSDTLFYVSSIYFASTKVKKTLLTVPIALLCNIIGAFLACFLCRFI